MPQLDFTTYSSQIFWLLICFAVLYIFAAFVILPRIREILKERKGVISADISSAEALDRKIEEMHQKTDALRKEATKQYQSKLEEVTKKASAEREKMVEELKDKIENMTKKSRSELRDFVEKTQSKSAEAVQSLAQKIKEKIFGVKNV